LFRRVFEHDSGDLRRGGAARRSYALDDLARFRINARGNAPRGDLVSAMGRLQIECF
jgi:hypothetical protein